MNPAYERIVWENYPSTATAVNATNLNKMDAALKTVDDRVVDFDTTKANQEDLLQCLKNVTYNTQTGLFTFTWQNGNSLQVDLNIEKIPVSFSMSAQGVITMITADGTTYTCDVSSLLKTYNFINGNGFVWTVTNTGNNYSVALALADGSITESKLETNFLANCRSAEAGAQSHATAASGSALDAEAWANGERNGQPVPSTDPAYHNNAKYWKDHAAATHLSGLDDVNIVNPAEGDRLTYNGTTSTWENKAGGGTLASLEDVDIRSIANGQYLRWNQSSGKFEPISNSAKNTSYNHDTSGMTATNVQAAIDELYVALVALQNSLGDQVTFTLDGTSLAINTKS